MNFDEKYARKKKDINKKKINYKKGFSTVSNGIWFFTSESQEVLPYFGNVKHNSAASDDFTEVKDDEDDEHHWTPDDF